MENLEKSLKIDKIFTPLHHEWPTQNWSVNRIYKNAKNLDFLSRILTKTEQKHPKYRKSAEFQNKLRTPKLLFGQRVGHPCFRSSSKRIPQQTPWIMHD